MPTFKLTPRGLAALKPPAAGFVEAWDTIVRGFGQRIAASGLRTWVVRYRHAGRRRRLKLGTAPPLTLAAARKRARKALADHQHGGDPAAARHEDRTAPTFGGLAALYLEKHAVRKRSAREDQRIIERELLPRWRHVQARALSRADVLALLDDIAAGRGRRRRPGRPAPIMANRVLALVRKVFNFGIQRGLVVANPCALVARPAAERRRDRVLTEDEIRGLWLGLDGIEREDETEKGEPIKRGEDEQPEPEPLALAAPLRLMLLTAQRRGEVLRMRWKDVTEEQGGAWWWTVPPEHSKNGLAHRVPLSAQALAIVEAMRPLAVGGPWVFPGRLQGRHVVNVETATDRARARQQLEHFTAHDLRRTAASLMTGLGIPRLTVKKLLNHADPDVTAVYDRHSYDAEKRAALDRWGRRVAAIVGEALAADVVPIRG